MSLTDHQIASRAGAGDVAAFVQLVERYRAPLIAYVYGLTGARDDREVIGDGTHERVVVNVARFDDRVQRKLGGR